MRAIEVLVLVFSVLLSLLYIGLSLYFHIFSFAIYQKLETDVDRFLVFFAFFTFIAQLVLGVMVIVKIIQKALRVWLVATFTGVNLIFFISGVFVLSLHSLGMSVGIGLKILVISLGFLIVTTTTGLILCLRKQRKLETDYQEEKGECGGQ